MRASTTVWQNASTAFRWSLAERLNGVPLEKVSLNLAEPPSGAEAEEADPSSVS